jgi:hypothetical protein
MIFCAYTKYNINILIAEANYRGKQADPQEIPAGPSASIVPSVKKGFRWYVLRNIWSFYEKLLLLIIMKKLLLFRSTMII